MSQPGNQPVGLSPIFRKLPNETLNMVYKFAAEDAAAAFKTEHVHYERIWTLKFRIPYCNFSSRDLTDDEANTVRRVFFPLLQASPQTRYYASKHVGMVYNRNMPPKLVLKSIDTFLLEGEAFQTMINASSVSNDGLRAMAGMTTIIVYPGVLQQTFQRTLDVLKDVSKVAVPSSTFMSTDVSQCCRELLLLLPSLTTIYVKHGIGQYGVHCFTTIQRPEKDYAKTGYVEIGEISGGSFGLRLSTKGTLRRAYELKFSKVCGYQQPSQLTPHQRDSLQPDSRHAWNIHRVWKQHYMNDFVSHLGRFIEEGINCVVVANCGYVPPVPGRAPATPINI
ncbi:hypothetical protein Hte_010026 [Hypoxylon texense]